MVVSDKQNYGVIRKLILDYVSISNWKICWLEKARLTEITIDVNYKS